MKNLAPLAARLLAARLTRAGMAATAGGPSVRLGKAPTVEIRMERLSRHPVPSGGTLLQVDVRFAFNAGAPESFVPTAATGWGATDDEAVERAVEGWATTTAPPLLSVLHGRGVLGAQWLPDGDEDGVRGWDCFSGPYVFHGRDADDVRTLRADVERVPLLAPIRAALADSLDPSALWHFATVYLGDTRGERYVECLVDGRARPELADALAAARPPLEVAFASVRQAVFCMRPSS